MTSLRNWFNSLLERLNLGGRDLTVFILSLMLAFSIWLIYNLSLNYTGVVSVPVTAHSNIEGHAQVSSTTSAVVARCNTTGFKLIGLKHYSNHNVRDVFIASTDLHGDGGEDFHMTPDELVGYIGDIFGDGVRVESFISRNVKFRFPYENNKKVPVQPVQNLLFRSQFMARGGMKVEPDSVVIYGEPFHLEKIDRVLTRTISLSDLHTSAHGVVKIEPVAGVRMSETSVNYSLEVSRFVEIPTTVAVRVRNVPPGRELAVFPSTAEVVFHCTFPVTDNPTEDVVFYVDYKDFEESINGRCVARTSGMPEGVIDWRIDPQVFSCVEKSRK